MNSAAVAVLDQGMDLAGDKVDAGQQADRAVALVLKLAREGRVHARFERQRLLAWAGTLIERRHRTIGPKGRHAYRRHHLSARKLLACNILRNIGFHVFLALERIVKFTPGEQRIRRERLK